MPLAAAVALVWAGMAVAAPAGGGCAKAAAYDCALRHVAAREFEAAIGLLEAEHGRTATDLKVINLLGIALTGAGRVDEANARFRAALAQDPRFYPARKNLAINEFNLGRLDEAERELEVVLREAPEDEVAHLHLAEIHFARRDTRRALAHYEMGRDRVVQSAVSTLHYARCLLAERRPRDAVKLLDALPDRDAEARFQAGLALGEARAHLEAARFFASARAGYHDPGVAGYNQALMLFQGGANDAVVAVVDELVEAGLGSADLLNLASKAHLEAGRVVEAYDALRAAVRLDPTAEQNYFDLAAICLRHENYELGLEIVELGLGVLPDSLGLRLHRGVLLAEKGMVPQAEAEFERARQLAPGSPAPSVGLAMALMQTGQAPRAVEILREAARADSQQAMVPYVLGLALVRSGADPLGPEGMEAAAAFEDAVRKDPGFSAAHGELGKLLLKQGRVESAVEALETARTLDPDNAGAAYMLARAYQAAGDGGRAREILRAAQPATEERDDDSTLRRAMIRIVREGSAPPAAPAAER